MKDDKHTPGPWKVRKRNGWHKDGDSYYIPGVTDPNAMLSKKDAELIASAPTLKAELEAARLDLADCKKEMDERLDDYNLTILQKEKEIAELKDHLKDMEETAKECDRETWDRACRAQFAKDNGEGVDDLQAFALRVSQNLLAEYQP